MKDQAPIELDSHTEHEEWKAGRQEMLIIYSLALISLMVALDASIVVTALPSIAAALHATSTQSFWVGTSYVLPNTASQLFFASLSNTFGRRQLYIPSLILFAIGSIVAATAHSIAVLLIGRVIQGVGGGGLTAMTIVIITDIIPLRSRPKYIAINSAAWAVGTIIGPILGGVLSSHSTWRWIFWLMLPFCGLGLVIFPFVVRLRMPPTTLSEKLHSIDFLGFAIFIPSLTSFLVAISWAGSMYPWSHAATLVPLLCGALGLTLTLFYEIRFAKHPFFRPTLFTNNTSAIPSYASAMIQGSLLFATLYALPLYFSTAKSHSATRSGVDLLPTLASFVPASIVAGVLSSKTGHFRWTIHTGWLLITLSTGLFILWTQTTPTAVWAVIQILFGIGHGFVLTGTSTATQASARPEDAGNAGAMYTFSRQLGTAIGIPIVTATWQNFMRTSLEHDGLDAGIAENAVGYVAVLKGMGRGTERTALVNAYVAGWRGTFYVFTGIAGFGLVLSLLIRGMSMDQTLKSEHVIESSRSKDEKNGAAGA